VLVRKKKRRHQLGRDGMVTWEVGLKFSSGSLGSVSTLLLFGFRNLGIKFLSHNMFTIPRTSASARSKRIPCISLLRIQFIRWYCRVWLRTGKGGRLKESLKLGSFDFASLLCQFVEQRFRSLQERVRRLELFHTTLFQDENLVRIHDRLDTMGNGQDRTVLELLANGSLNSSVSTSTAAVASRIKILVLRRRARARQIKDR